MHNVLSLSLELLRNIASFLDISDFAAFALSHYELRLQLLGNERFCKDVVNVSQFHPVLCLAIPTLMSS